MKIKMAFGFAVTAMAACVAFGADKGKRINSEGDWPSHLQGVCTDGTNIWWSHTVELARTDLNGKVLAHAKGLKSHHGDLCIANGTLYVAVNLGQFNTEQDADSWVYAYKSDDLAFIKRWKVPELRHGAGGITYKDGHFFVVGGLPPTHGDNYVYEYTPGFEFVERHVLKSGWTNLGIQTVSYHGGRFYFGCYGGRNELTGENVPTLTIVSNPDFSVVSKVKESTSEGLVLLYGHAWRAVLHKIQDRPRRFTVSLVPVSSPELAGIAK